MKADPHRKPRPPLDAEGIERLALFYASRYETSRAKLRSYLGRKLRERGWKGGGEPPVERIVERFSQLGYIDDRAFAIARAGSLQRRGYGAHRVEQAFYAAGIEAADAVDARQQVADGAWNAALRYAERKHIGPFAAEVPDREARQKAFAAMMRAGHPSDLVRRVINAAPGQIPDLDTA